MAYYLDSFIFATALDKLGAIGSLFHNFLPEELAIVLSLCGTINGERLQWPVWRKAWKLVNKSSNSCGTVVSSGHQKFTIEKNQISSNKLFQIPAGVDLEKFSPGESTGLLRLIYHGRLDKHRGVLALPMLVRKAITAGLDISLKLIGDGDCFSDLQKISSDFDEITFFPTMST